MEPDRPELVRVDTLTPAVLRDAFRRALMESGAVAQLSTVTGDDLLLEAETRRANRFTIDLPLCQRS